MTWILSPLPLARKDLMDNEATFEKRNGVFFSENLSSGSHRRLSAASGK